MMFNRLRLKQWVALVQVGREAGFTALELLIGLVVMGILSSIAIPSWLGLMQTLKLDASQDQVYHLLHQAKSNAIRDNIIWQVSFRQQGPQLQAAVHPAVGGQFLPREVNWQEVGKVRVDVAETTLDCSQSNCQFPENLWRVQFNHWGNTNGRLGRLTFTNAQNPRIKRCVIVSTLIGNMRLAQQRLKPNERGRYCY